MQTRTRRRLVLTAAAVILTVIAASVLAYALFLRGDNVAPLALGSPAAASPNASNVTPSSKPPASAGSPIAGLTDLAGNWQVGAGSVVGYRVREKLADLPAESDAVGRTESISGTATIAVVGDAVTVATASLRADLTTLTSDNGRRDARLRTSGLESSRFPTATFTLAEPVPIVGDILSGVVLESALVGDLTLHGVTRRVSIPVQARFGEGSIEVVGSLTFPFADYDMTPPEVAGFVTVEDDATLEFMLVLVHG